jgi:hypothetical protein
MPQGRSCGSSVTVAPAASVLARSASTSAPDDVAETELAALRRPLRDPGVLGELAARVESANQAAVEPEHDDGAGRIRVIVGVFGGSYAVRLEAESVAVEGKRALEVAHRQRDHVAGIPDEKGDWGTALSPARGMTRSIKRGSRIASPAQVEGRLRRENARAALSTYARNLAVLGRAMHHRLPCATFVSLHYSPLQYFLPRAREPITRAMARPPFDPRNSLSGRTSRIRSAMEDEAFDCRLGSEGIRFLQARRWRIVPP